MWVALVAVGGRPRCSRAARYCCEILNIGCETHVHPGCETHVSCFHKSAYERFRNRSVYPDRTPQTAQRQGDLHLRESRFVCARGPASYPVPSSSAPPTIATSLLSQSTRARLLTQSAQRGSHRDFSALIPLSLHPPSSPPYSPVPPAGSSASEPYSLHSSSSDV